MNAVEIIALCSLLLCTCLLLKFHGIFGERNVRAAEKHKARSECGDACRESRRVPCLRCRRQLQIKIPPASNLGRCPGCGFQFVIVCWDSQHNLYISGVEETGTGESKPGEAENRPLTDCLRLLALDPGPGVEHITLAEIRRAYYKTIQHYHPDRYLHLPSEFQRVAESKTRQLNAAYDKLVRYKTLKRPIQE